MVGIIDACQYVVYGELGEAYDACYTGRATVKDIETLWNFLGNRP
jgi:hypothetical protein